MRLLGKLSRVVLCILLGFSFLQSAYIGKVYFKASDGKRLKRIGDMSQVYSVPQMIRERAPKEGSLSRNQTLPLRNQTLISPAYIGIEIGKGNLKLRRIENDRVAMMEHRRYTQYYRGLEVLGGQIIQHLRQGRLVSTTGEYYEGVGIDTTPFIDATTASQLYMIHLAKPDLREGEEGSKLIIYPVTDGDYRLAYLVTMNSGFDFSMTGIIDAKRGEVIKEYSNVNYDGLTIGLGTGVHGEQFKLPTTYANNMYWLADYSRVRPVNQITRDYGNSDNIASDADNIWDSDGALVSVHAYVGLTYDYCYSVLGRAGLDDTNQQALIAHVNYPTADIAFWTDGEMFVDTPTAGALDIVAHEYAHGITQYSSGLLYYCDANAQPGALNEAFSDIIGTAVEFHWQPEGQGFDKADWLIGEDIDPPYIGNQYYGATSYLRDLSDPNSTTWKYSGVNYPYPCHLSQCRLFQDPEVDFGGVHFNSTLYSHAYYLLAAGGTNRVSRLSVSGIGIEKATKIFYRAWTHYMTPTADYLFAANCLLQSAGDLYGASSNEYAQTINAMEAIGWTFN